MFLNGGPMIPSDADESDLMQLAAEGFLQINSGKGAVQGKITARGLEAASQIVPTRLPPPPYGPVAAPTFVRLPVQGPTLAANPTPVQEPPETMSTTAPPPSENKRPVVFIGHGQRLDWLQLEKFLTKRGLGCVEFNSESAAGMTTQDRLKDMIKQSGFAFLVMTAEDKLSDGTFHARQNVIHEAGLCHGLLGLDKAILLLEDGCTKFSNGDGITHIGFQAGNIKSAFHDVQELLAAKGLISQ